MTDEEAGMSRMKSKLKLLDEMIEEVYRRNEHAAQRLRAEYDAHATALCNEKTQIFMREHTLEFFMGLWSAEFTNGSEMTLGVIEPRFEFAEQFSGSYGHCKTLREKYHWRDCPSYEDFATEAINSTLNELNGVISGMVEKGARKFCIKNGVAHQRWLGDQTGYINSDAMEAPVGTLEKFKHRIMHKFPMLAYATVD